MTDFYDDLLFSFFEMIKVIKKMDAILGGMLGGASLEELADLVDALVATPEPTPEPPLEADVLTEDLRDHAWTDGCDWIYTHIGDGEWRAINPKSWPGKSYTYHEPVGTPAFGGFTRVVIPEAEKAGDKLLALEAELEAARAERDEIAKQRDEFYRQVQQARAAQEQLHRALYPGLR